MGSSIRSGEQSSIQLGDADGESRRAFLGIAGTFIASRSLAAAGSAPRSIPAASINHVGLQVSDADRSVRWYQRLFGLPVVARQGAARVLRIGDGPQSLVIAGEPNERPQIGHMGISTKDFQPQRALDILAEHRVAPSSQPGPLQAQLKNRGPELEGDPNGTAELLFGDPDGIVVQLQDTRYCGGAGPLGDRCRTEKPVPTDGVLQVRDFNHCTLFVRDQARSVAFYRQMFGLPIDTYQGQLPILRVGSGNQFLALVAAGGGRRATGFIHHVCLTVRQFHPDRILDALKQFGVTPRGDSRRPVEPLQSYVTMRMPDRGGAVGGTPELYLTDPDGILLQIQDERYCGGSGYLGDRRGQGQR